MSERREDVISPQPSQSPKGGFTLPALSAKVKRGLIVVGVGVIVTVFMCTLPVWLAGWWGYNAISGQAPTTRVQRHVSVFRDPLGCQAHGLSVMRWVDRTGDEQFRCVK